MLAVTKISGKSKMQIMMLKDLARLRLAIAYRQFGDYRKSLKLFEELIKQTENNPKCQAMAYTGKMITLIKLIKMGEPQEELYGFYDKYQKLVLDKPGIEDDFMRFYKIRFVKEILKLDVSEENVKSEIDKIINNVVITENNDSDNLKVVLNVPSEWSSDILANYWEVISICYSYLDKNYSNKMPCAKYCIRQSRTFAQKVELLSDKFTIFSEVELKDIPAKHFLKELAELEHNEFNDI